MAQRHATGDMKHDAAMSEVIQAEERVLRYLRAEYGAKSVKDLRKQHKGYDFTVKTLLATRKIDVKADMYATKTGRLAWEGLVQRPDGTKKPGWGLLNLDTIAVVVADSDRLEAWRLYICDARRWRNYIERPAPLTTWVRFDMNNKDGSIGIGWAVPIAELQREGIILNEVFI